MTLSSSLSVAPRRSLGVLRLLAVIFFCVSGGAYGLEDTVGAVGPFWALIALLLLPWLWSLPMALMTAELSAAMPEDGGYVVWVERAFGPFWGFQEGWWSWLSSFADNALYPVLFTDYLVDWAPHLGAGGVWTIRLGMVAFLTLANIRGAAPVASGSVFFTLAVLAPFVILVAAGIPQLHPAAWLTGLHQHHSLAAWSALLTVVLWNGSGWDNAGCCAGEVKTPGRSYALAMPLAVALVSLAYLLPVAVGVGAAPDWHLWKDGYFQVIAGHVGGRWLGLALSAGGCASALGLFAVLLLTSSRVTWAMAKRGTIPRLLARLHPRYGTPWTALLFNSLGSALLIGWASHSDSGPFVALLRIDMLLYSLALLLEFAALIWLRLKHPSLERPYRVPGGPPGVIAFCIPPAALCAISMVICPVSTLAVGAAGIAAGVVAYRASYVRRGGER